MTSPQSEIRLTIVTHEDVYLSVTTQREGWGNAYQEKAAVVHLSKADLEKAGLKDHTIVEVTGPAESVVVTARADATCEAGVGFMPSSLYTNRLISYEPGSSTLPGKIIEARVMPTDKDITAVSDLILGRNRA